MFSLFAFSVSAQEDPLVGKKGQLLLPEAGDIGLGVNMIPFFNWFGNAFNANTNNQFASNNKFFSIFGNSVVMGKYMLTDKTAIRVNFGFNLTSTTENKYVQDDTSNDPFAKVMDSRKADNGHYTIALGYEMRRGKGRIQGYYGADLMIRVQQSSGFAYTYGNGFGQTNVVPTAHNWGSNIISNKRVLSDGGTTIFGIGVRGFIGVEYFVAPKLSIGCEFGWGLSVNSTFGSKNATEHYDASESSVVIENNKTAGATTFSAGVDNMNGAVFMMFYF